MPKLTPKVETKLEGLLVENSPESDDNLIPRMPVRMADLTSAELSNMMSEMGAWREYVESLYIQAMIEHKRLDTELEYIFARKKMEIENNYKKSLTREVKALKFAEDDSIFAHKKSLDDASLYKEALSIRLDSLTNNINVLSREITRRQTINVRT